MRALLIGSSLALAACAPAASTAPSPALPAAQQHARDPSCSGECLDGKDPFESGCAADARTVKLAHVVTNAGRVIGVVELRESRVCATGWARILRTDETLDGEIVGGITVDGGATWLTHQAKHAVSLWTDMHYLPPQACVAASVVLRDAAGHALADEARADDCLERTAGLSQFMTMR